MVEILVILGGATDWDLADTPSLDRLAADGSRSTIDLLPAGVPVGSETAIAALLGWTPSGPVDRARVEAAARGIDRADVRRIDLPDDGVRLLVFGDTGVQAGGRVREWPRGAVPPRVLDTSTVVIGALGAATGLGALMGARVVVPPGATGGPDTDLGAKRQAALDAIAGGAARVVVHVGGPDEAAHRRDRAAKLACVEAADAELIGPLADAVVAVGGSIRVCADHGTDPETGDHIGGPVPCVYSSAPTPPALVPA